MLAAAVVGALLALVIGAFSLRRLRSDYQAIVMLVVSLIATLVATNDVGLVNGPNGLSLVPKPLSSVLGLPPYGVQYQRVFVGITAAACLVGHWFAHRICSAPLRGTLRASRESSSA